MLKRVKALRGTGLVREKATSRSDRASFYFFFFFFFFCLFSTRMRPI